MKRKPQLPWPQEDMDTLRVLWDSGITVQKMREAFLEKGKDYSRNALIGKARRLKLTPKESGLALSRAERKPKPVPNTTHAAKVFGNHYGPPIPKDPKPIRKQAWEPIPGVLPVSLMERTGCCWIVTQDSPFLYCNHSVDEGSKLSYCSHHLDMYVSKERPARIRVKGLV